MSSDTTGTRFASAGPLSRLADHMIAAANLNLIQELYDQTLFARHYDTGPKPLRMLTGN